MPCVFSNAPQQRTKYPRAALSTLFSWVADYGLHTPVYNTDADDQDYGLVLRLAGFAVNRAVILIFTVIITTVTNM